MLLIRGLIICKFVILADDMSVTTFLYLRYIQYSRKLIITRTCDCILINVTLRMRNAMQ